MEDDAQELASPEAQEAHSEEHGGHTHESHDHAHEEHSEEHSHEGHEHLLEDAGTGAHSHGGGDLWTEYLNLLTDPAHIMFELTISILFDLFIVYLGYQLLFKRIILPKLRRDIHREIDAEHHVQHHDHVEGDDSASCAVPQKIDKEEV